MLFLIAFTYIFVIVGLWFVHDLLPRLEFSLDFTFTDIHHDVSLYNFKFLCQLILSAFITINGLFWFSSLHVGIDILLHFSLEIYCLFPQLLVFLADYQDPFVHLSHFGMDGLDHVVFVLLVGFCLLHKCLWLTLLIQFFLLVNQVLHFGAHIPQC